MQRLFLGDNIVTGSCRLFTKGLLGCQANANCPQKVYLDAKQLGFQGARMKKLHYMVHTIYTWLYEFLRVRPPLTKSETSLPIYDH